MPLLLAFWNSSSHLGQCEYTANPDNRLDLNKRTYLSESASLVAAATYVCRA